MRDVVLSVDSATNTWSVEFSAPTTLQSHYNEAGRGMELSELVNFNG
jgi:hypothetical protein